MQPLVTWAWEDEGETSPVEFLLLGAVERAQGSCLEVGACIFTASRIHCLENWGREEERPPCRGEQEESRRALHDFRELSWEEPEKCHPLPPDSDTACTAQAAEGDIPIR